MTAVDQLAARLAADGVVGVILGWLDNSGLHRVKAVPVEKLAGLSERGVSMSTQLDAALPNDDQVAGAITREPDIFLVPDLDQTTTLTALNGWAWAPANRMTVDGNPHELCQRSFAQRMEAMCAERGLEVRIGIEVEWWAGTKLPEGFRPLGDGPGFGMVVFTQVSDYLRDLVTTLRADGFEIVNVHPEHQPGAFEISLSPLPPIRAADAVVLVRESIRAVSMRRGVDVSFAPVMEIDKLGIGAHLHVSLWRERENLCGSGTLAGSLTPTAYSFFAGLLQRLPSVLAVATPSVTSYLRLQPAMMSGAFQEWSRITRSTALRMLPAGKLRPAEAANVEIKCFDATANPYLLVGCIMALGIAGIDEGLRLPAEACADDLTVALDRESTNTQSRLTRLPRSLDEAMAHLRQDRILQAVMPAAMYRAIVQAREAELVASASVPMWAAVEGTRWRY